MSYRKNLAMARESFPAAPVLSTHDRVLVLSPHCDDETLGAGGTIAEARSRGLAVRVAFMTNGDGSRSTQIAETVRHLRRDSFQQLAAMRQRETVAALQELGVARQDIIFLGYPDGGTQMMWQKNWTADAPYRSPFTGADHSPYADSLTPNAPYCGQAALRDVTRLVEEFRPTIVFTTHPSDTHPDHWAAYAYACAALEALRLRADTASWARRTRLLTFLVHHGVWPTPHGYHPDAPLAPPADLKNIGTQWLQTPLGEPARAAKKAALSRYVSQMAFTPHYLRSFLRRNELFGIVPVETTVETTAAAATTRTVQTAAQVPVSAPLSNGRSPHSSNGVSVGATALANSASAIDVVRDQTRDSLLHDLWAAADLQKISWRQDAGPNVMTLRIALGQSPANTAASGRLRYRLSLHVVTAQSARAWTIVAGGYGPSLQAELQPMALPSTASRSATLAKPEHESDTRPLTVRRVAGGLEVEIPRAVLGLPASATESTITSAAQRRASGTEQDLSEAITLLLSASTHFGGRRLDQTATGALRLAPAHSVSANSVSANSVSAK